MVSVGCQFSIALEFPEKSRVGSTNHEEELFPSREACCEISRQLRVVVECDSKRPNQSDTEAVSGLSFCVRFKRSASINRFMKPRMLDGFVRFRRLATDAYGFGFHVWLSRLWSGWRSALIIVKPETVIGWHRQGFRVVVGSGLV
jgi:hypothetical protein